MSGRGGQKGGTWRTLGGFLTEDLEDGVILEVMDDLGRVQGSCSESFVEFSLFLAVSETETTTCSIIGPEECCQENS